MSNFIEPKIERLFAGSNEPGERLFFEWRMIRRQGQPFLLVPVTGTRTRVSLTLYSAQRRRAKICRALFPGLIHSPAVRWFDRIGMSIDASSDLIQFLARQSGVPVEQLKAPAIKFGGVEPLMSRLVILLVDPAGHPLQVVKVGLDKAGRAATQREADFLEQLPASIPGCIRLAGRMNTAAATAFATDYFPGESPVNDAGLEDVFHAWLNPGEAVPVASLAGWQQLENVAKNDPSLTATLANLQAAMAGTKVRSTLYHGDFAPWNLRVDSSGKVQAFDWERGARQGIPGWDWFHFIIQTAILVRRLPVECVAGEVEQLVASPRFGAYASAAGINAIVQPLVLGYLAYQLSVIHPREGRRETAELYDLLSARWNLQPMAVRFASLPKKRAVAVRQLQSAWSLVTTAFWEPRLNFQPKPPLTRQLAENWKMFLMGALLLAGTVILQIHSSEPAAWLPFYYLFPCMVLTLSFSRSWGILAALVATALASTHDFIDQPEVRFKAGTLGNFGAQFGIMLLILWYLDKARKAKAHVASTTGMEASTPPLGNQAGPALGTGVDEAA